MSYGKIIEFTNINFYCESDANPHDINYKWYLNDELMGGEHMNEVVCNFLFVYLNFLTLRK